MGALSVCLFLGLPAAASAQGLFVRGDCNEDRRLDIADPIGLLGFLFLGAPGPKCEDACDVDDNEAHDISDAIALLNYLYLGGDPPPAPFGEEGLDPDGTALACDNDRLPLLELRVSPAELLLYRVGDSQPLQVVGIVEGETPGVTVAVDLRTNARTTYRIDRADVASISSAGVVTAQAPGVAAVTVEHQGRSARVTVKVAASAAGAPLVRISVPLSGAVVTSVSVIVAGTVSDPGARVTVNGAAAVVEAGTGSFTGRADLVLGPNRIAIAASGERGEGLAEIQVTRAAPGTPEAVGPDGQPLPLLPDPFITPSDRTPPALAIESPRAGAVLASSEVEVRGTVNDPLAAVRVGGARALVDGGRFAARLTLPRGPATITAEAVDPAGNRAAAAVDVTVDLEVPAVTITDPPARGAAGGVTFAEGAALTASSPIVVRGTLSRPGMLVWVQGRPATVNGTAFSGAADLSRGFNRVTVLAEIPGSPPRRAVAARTVILDLDPPALEIVYPPPGHVSRTTPVRVAGRVSSPGVPAGAAGPVTVKINGASVPADGGSFELSLPLLAGPNTITVRATDAAGREVEDVRMVTLDSGGAASLELVDGGDQTVGPGVAAPRPLIARARDALGSPNVRVPVVFRVVSGDGVFAGGTREEQVMTNAAGEARVIYTAGRAAGRGRHVVTAAASGWRGSPLGYHITVLPAPPAVLAAHGPRWQAGTAGLPLERPLLVRALDAAGNPVAGVAVELKVTSGSARFAGAASASVMSGSTGLAGAALTLGGVADEVNTIEAAAAGGLRATLVVESLVTGAAADTRAAGMALSWNGAPLSGLTVRCADIPELTSVTDDAGRFELAGMPSGPVLLEVLGGQVAGASGPGASGQGGAFASTSREAFLVPGRRNVLREPLRLAPLAAGPRAAEIPVSELSGGAAAVPAIPGMRLEVAPGAARFADGSQRGRVTLVAAPRDALGPAPDWTSIEFPILVLPEDVRFDPPARLFIPNPRHGAGRELVLYTSPRGAAGLIEEGAGLVGEDRAFVESRPGQGITAGGPAWFAVPGPWEGRAASQPGTIGLPGPSGSAEQRPESPVVGAGVYAHSGELFVEVTDLVVRGRGLDYTFRRRYESRHGFRGSLGFNWEHEYADRRLEPVAGSSNLVRADGRGRFDEYLWSAAREAYVSPLGVYARLTAEPGGELVEREPDGTRYRYRALDGSAGAGRLLEIADRHENRLSIIRGDDGRIASVRDTLGRSIAYLHDSEGRIARVTDFAGRSVAFSYDANGDLAAVTGPAIVRTPNGNDFPQGRTTRYEYRSASGDSRLDHNLLKVFAPNESSGGPPRLVNRYEEDPASPAFDRVTAQDWGGTNGSGAASGGTLTIEYRLGSKEAVDPLGSLLDEGGMTIVTDRRGLRTEIEWNRLGLAIAERRFTRGDLRPRDPGSLHPGPGVDPPFFETRHRWSEEGHLLETAFPRGNRLRYERDRLAPLRSSRSNVVARIHDPAPGSPGSALPEVWTYLYDPLFGRLVGEVPPRGNQPGYVPPNGGTASPERYATRYFLDYQEGSDLAGLASSAGVAEDDLADALARAGMTLGLGDLNGDGDTTGARGDVVLAAHPAAVLPNGAVLPDGSVQEAKEAFTYNHLGQLLSRVDAEGRVTRWRYHPETDPDGDGQPSPEPGLNPNTGGHLAERVVDPEGAGGFPPAALRTTYLYDPLGRPARATDGRGSATELIHNEAGELILYRAPAPLNYQRWFFYDANGNLVRAQVENFTANLDGFPLPVPKNRWIETSWAYDILDHAVTETREVSGGDVGPARSVVTVYRYDPNGNLAMVVRPEGDEETYAYDERDLLFQRTRGTGAGLDPGGTAADRFDYDENGGLSRTLGPDSDGDGRPEETVYRSDGFDRPAARIDPAGGAWTLERDPDGRVTSEAFVGSAGGPPAGAGGGGGGELLVRRRRFHDERGREYRRSLARFGPGVPPGAEPLAETTWHDRSGLPVKIVGAAGEVSTVERDGAGRPARETDAAGDVLERRYDASGNVILERRIDLSAEPIAPVAGAAGDPDYDPSGRYRLTSITAYVYDALNRLNVSLDAGGRTRRYRYDSRGNMVHATDAVGTVIHAGLDPELAPLVPLLSARQADRANAHGNQAHFEYDGLDRLVAAVHELRLEGEGQRGIDHGNPFNDDGTITELFEWDDDGRRVASVDDRGGRTEAEYDRLGMLRSRTDADGVVERYDYDLAGNLVQVVDRTGTIIRQSFDRLGRVIRREVEPHAGSDGIAPEGTRLQRFEYDGLGRPTLAFDGNQPEDPADDALVLRAYDSAGLLAFECQGPYIVSVERSAGGRPAALVYPDGRRLFLERDGLGRVREVRDAARVHARLDYAGARRQLSRAFGNGMSQSYLSPDTTGVPRLTGYALGGEVEEEAYVDAGGNPLLGFEYGHDRAGRKLFDRHFHRERRGPAIRYDSIGRLREVQPDLFDPRFPLSTPTVFTRLFLDGSHNPRLAIVNFVEEKSEVDAIDRLTSVAGRPVSFGSAGHLVAAQGLELRYDAFGRLVRASRAGSVLARYAYDATGAWDPREFRGKGRPARREVLPGAPGGEAPGAYRTIYLLDRALEERREAGGPLWHYMWGPDGRALAALDFQNGGAPVYYLSSGSGTVVGVAGESGSLLEEIRYDVFGNPVFYRSLSQFRDISFTGSRLLQGGRRWDPVLRLVEVGARHFSPALSRFIERGGERLPGQPLSLNRYAFLDPLNGLAAEASSLDSDGPDFEWTPSPAELGRPPGANAPAPSAAGYLPPGVFP